MKRDKEWIKKQHRDVWSDFYSNLEGMGKLRDRIEDLIDQLEEPEKVTIPQFMADFIEGKKGEVSLIDIGYFASRDEWNDKGIGEYIRSSFENFSKAWLDGYVVEKEKLYYVVDEKGQTLLFKSQERGIIRSNGADLETVLMVYEHKPSNMYQLTEKEIKDYDERYWFFAMEVVES